MRFCDAKMGTQVIHKPAHRARDARVGTIISAAPLELWINGYCLSETRGQFSVHVAFPHGNEWVQLSELRRAGLERGIFVPLEDEL